MSNSTWPHGLQPAGLLCPRDSPGKNTGVGCHALLREIFPMQPRDGTRVSGISGGFFTMWVTREAPCISLTGDSKGRNENGSANILTPGTELLLTHEAQSPPSLLTGKNICLDFPTDQEWGEGLTHFHNYRCLYWESKPMTQFCKIAPQCRSKRKFCWVTSMPLTVSWALSPHLLTLWGI